MNVQLVQQMDANHIQDSDERCLFVLMSVHTVLFDYKHPFKLLVAGNIVRIFYERRAPKQRSNSSHIMKMSVQYVARFVAQICNKHKHTIIFVIYIL